MKKIILFFIFVLTSVTMVGCGTTNKDVHKSDYMIVYNAKGKKVATITNHKSVDWVSDELGDVGDHNPVKLPTNAKKSYHYVVRQVKPKYKIYMDVYSNNNLVKVSNIPILGKVVVRVPSQVAYKLNHPLQELK